MVKNTQHLRFYFQELLSPTLYNLCRYLQEQGWRRTKYQWRAHFSEQNLQFNLAAAESLEFKHLLAQLVAQFCPEVMPITYGINDHNWVEVLNRLSDQPDLQNLIWILKPALLNNGQHIKIFQNVSDLSDHYLNPQRMGGEHVLQEYLVNPHLLKGHKYSIRMFVITTNYAGGFIYPHGYMNVALKAYQPQQFMDLSSHLTNEHLSPDASNVIQIPTQRFDLFPSLFAQIKGIVFKTISGLQQLYPQAFIQQKYRTLAIFGFDFLVDKDLRVWLLEANHGACFPRNDDHPLQKYLYYDFWQALISSFVLPIASRSLPQNIQYRLFEPLM